MHPDALIEALETELEEVQNAPEKDAEREKQIKAEIERVDELPRPKAKPEEPETVFDPERAYLDALKAELEEVKSLPEKDAEREKQIKAEIERTEKHLKEKEDAQPSAEDDLDSKTREELNEHAASLGVEDPDKLPNKGAVIEAIQGARSE